MPNPTQDEEIDRILSKALKDYNSYLRNGILGSHIGAEAEVIETAKAALHRLMLKERLDELKRLNRPDLLELDGMHHILSRISGLNSQIEGSKSDE